MPGAKFGAKASAHIFGDHPHLALWQVKQLRQVVADTGSILSGGIDRQHIWLPVSHYAVRLQGAVGLYLRTEFPFHNKVCFRKTFFDITPGAAQEAARGRAAQVALLFFGCFNADIAFVALIFDHLFKYDGGAFPPCLIQFQDKRLGFVFYFDQLRRLVGNILRLGRHRSDRLPDVAQQGQLIYIISFRRRIVPTLPLY